MRLTTFGVAATATFLLMAAQASAATVIFDDFDQPQLAVDEPFVGSTTSSSIPFRDGTRTLEAENTKSISIPPSARIAATVLEVAGGSLSFSNKDQARGRGTVTYTNVGDISYGANPFFLFDVGVFDKIANFFASAVDMMGGTSTYSELLEPGFNPKLFFSQFQAAPMGGADFNNLDTLSFTIDSTDTFDAVDGSLDSISISAIPLPAGGLLLLSGLGGLLTLRRIKRA